MVLRRYGDKKPSLGADVFVDESAILIGEVKLHDKVSIWPGVVLRADDASVEIGRGSAVMDTAFAEAPKARPVSVGDHCIVSHSAVLHGCRVGNECLVGVHRRWIGARGRKPSHAGDEDTAWVVRDGRSREGDEGNNTSGS